MARCQSKADTRRIGERVCSGIVGREGVRGGGGGWGLGVGGTQGRRFPNPRGRGGEGRSRVVRPPGALPRALLKVSAGRFQGRHLVRLFQAWAGATPEGLLISPVAPNTPNSFPLPQILQIFLDKRSPGSVPAPTK